MFECFLNYRAAWILYGKEDLSREVTLLGTLQPTLVAAAS